MRQFTCGAELDFTSTFVDPKTGLGVNPTDVLLKLRDPNGVETDITSQGVETGVFIAKVTPMVAGTWSYRWQGTGTVTAAREGQFNVNVTDF